MPNFTKIDHQKLYCHKMMGVDSFLTLREQCCILSFHEGEGLDWKLRDLEGKDELGLVIK